MEEPPIKDEVAKEIFSSPDMDKEIPNAMDHDPDFKRQEDTKHQRIKLAFFIGFCFIILVVCITVPLVLKSTSVPAPEPTQSPSPVMTPMTIEETLEALVGENIYKEGTFHHNAYKWITEKDPAKLTSKSENLAQRFLLTFLSFAMGGNNWTYCAFPDNISDSKCHGTMLDEKGYEINVNASRWLSDDPECDWFGIVCVLEEIQEIQLCKLQVTTSALFSALNSM